LWLYGGSAGQDGGAANAAVKMTPEQVELEIRRLAATDGRDAAIRSLGSEAAASAVAVQPKPVQPLSFEEMSSVAKSAAQIHLGDPQGKGRSFLIFSDPLCPACRRMEPTVEVLVKMGYRPIVVPVAFKPGSIGLASTAVCQKENAKRAAVWFDVTRGSTTEKQCMEGEKQISANNELFKRLGFSHTPTIVSMSGVPVVDGGDVSPEKFAAWVDRNSPGHAPLATAPSKK
jgi:protein-disulfide isomerase